jgi:uncharacterized membrane protein YeaQ/YmgE (transglycosylase-associated protein family)
MPVAKKGDFVDTLAFARISGHHLIAWLVIGLIAGLLASLVVRGTGLGLVRDIIVGLAGAVIGGLILHAVTHGAHTSVKIWKEIVVAFVGAVILLLIIKVFDRSRSHSTTRRY